MDNVRMIWDIIGYVGSALVVVSLVMSSVVKLRIINLVGALIFSIYAFVICSYPTAVMNLAIVLVDLYYLFKLLATEKKYTAFPVSPEDSAVQNILSRYKEDMAIYFDVAGLTEANVITAAYDGSVLAGITAGIAKGDTIDLILDYTTPQYRNCTVGKFMVNRLLGQYKTITYSGNNQKHIEYVKKLGFVPEGKGYVKKAE